MFDLSILETLADDTPAGVFCLSGMSIQLLLAAAIELEFHSNWIGIDYELSILEQDQIDAAVALAMSELITPCTDDWGDAMANRVLARYYGATTQILANNAEAIIDFVTRDYDSHNAVVVGAAWRFTAPLAGFYHIEVRVSFQADAVDADPSMVAQLYISGVGKVYLARSRWAFPVGLSEMITGGDTIYLTQGQYIDIRLTNGSGGNATVPVSVLTNSIAITQVG